MDLTSAAALGPWGLAILAAFYLLQNIFKPKTPGPVDPVTPSPTPAPSPTPTPDPVKPATPILDLILAMLSKLLFQTKPQAYGDVPKPLLELSENSVALAALMQILRSDPNQWAQVVGFVEAQTKHPGRDQG